MPVSPWLVALAKHLEQVANLTVLLPLAIAGWQWPRLPRTLRLLAIYLVVAEATVLLGHLSELYRPHWHLAIWHAFTVVETLFFLRIYYLTLTSRLLGRLIIGVTPVFLVFAALDTFYLEGINQINSYTHVLQSAVLIGLALLYFEQLLNELRVMRLERDPLFLVSTAVVLYFSGTVLMYVFINHFLTTNDHAGNEVIYTINSVVNLVQYSLFALAFWYADKPSQAPAQL
jgi:hypothetical protein